MELDQKQQEAIALCCDVSKRVVAVTGEAGTGKTTIMRLVHQHLTEAGYSVALCAPTGKAAKRIQEATGISAVTLHRLLEFSHPGDPDPKTGKPRGESVPCRDSDNPLEYDVVLADEYAMVNNGLHRDLFDALPSGGCVRVFGDVNQLPPIEEDKRLEGQSSPFQNLLNKMPSVTLNVNHRQGKGSGIIENGHKINRGMIPRRTDDFKLWITDEPVKALAALVAERRVEGIDFSTLDHQILTISNIRWTGTNALNGMLQNMFSDPSRPFTDIPRHPWLEKKGITCRLQVGNKVIITKNNYDLSVFNGESGLVTEITEYGEIAIDLGDREVVFPPEVTTTNKYGKTVVYDPRKDIDLAFACTTHKFQGSECKHVIYVLNRSTCFMQSRQNTYTAVTRAREHVDLIADQMSLSRCVQKGRL